jgi:putative ATPase
VPLQPRTSVVMDLLLNIFELVINALLTANYHYERVLVFKTPFYMIKVANNYDIVSAFIKSIVARSKRAVYWLARMIEGGEKFIARRMLILSSEDIGNANPTAFIMANNTFQAVTTIDILKAELY